MKNLITLIALISIFASTTLSAQTKYTRIGLMAYPKPETPVLPDGVSSESNWIVPPLFLESERRFLKFFTIGSEITFGRMGIDNSVYGSEHSTRVTNIGLELQGKISIPIVEIFEVFGQYGIGYMHSFYSMKSDYNGAQQFDNNFGIGYISNTLSVGGSVILGKSIGLFVEAGVLKTKSVKNLNDLMEDSMSAYGSHIPTPALGAQGEQKILGETGFAKVGVVFQIN